MKNADRPAAPCKTSENTGGPHYQDVPHNGLTKREYFAGLAMQAMLSSKYSGEFMSEINDTKYDKPLGLANNAIRFADALLKELENERN